MSKVYERDEILAALDQTSDELLGMLARLTPAQRLERGATGEWRVKDVLSHLAFWNDVGYEELTVLARGERTGKSYNNYLEINDQVATQERDRPLAEVEAHFMASHERLANFLKTLPAEQWSRSVRRWAWITMPEHYAEHSGHLKAWLNSM